MKHNFLLNATQVAQILSLGVSTVWAKAKQGLIPVPIKISTGITRWQSSHIDEYVADPIAWVARNKAAKTGGVNEH